MSENRTGKVGKALIFLVLFLILGVGGIWLFRSSLLEAAAQSYLQQQGLSDVEITVSAFDTDQLALQQVQIAPVVTATDLRIDYRLSDLLEGNWGRITVQKLALDVSNLDHPLYQWINRLATSDEESVADAAPTRLPELVIERFEITEQSDLRRMSAMGHLTVAPDQQIQMQAKIDAALLMADGAFTLTGADVSLTGNLQDLSATMTLQNAVLTGGGSDAAFKPLTISGSGSVADSDAQFEIAVAADGAGKLLSLTGAADLQAQKGQVSYELSRLSFTPSGLQPGHILSALAELPKFTANLASSGHATLNQDQVEISGKNTLTGLKLEQASSYFDLVSLDTQFMVQANLSGLIKKINIKSQLVNLKAKISDVGVRVPTASLIVSGSGLEDLTFDASADLLSSDRADLFPAVAVTLTGSKAGDNVNFSGDIKGLDDKLSLDYEGDLHASAGEGRLSAHLRPLQLGASGVSLDQLSSLFKDLNLQESGTLSLDLTSRWDSSLDPRFSISGDLENGHIQTSEVTIDAAELSVAANDIKPQESFQLLVRDVTAHVDASDQAATVIMKEISLAVQKGWQSANMAPTKITLKPAEKTVWKPQTDLNLSGLIGRDNIKMQGDIVTVPTGNLARFSLLKTPDAKGISADLDLSPLSFSDVGLTLEDLFRNLPEDLEVTGKVAAKLSADLGGDEISGTGTITLQDLLVDQAGLRLEGVNGTVHITDFFPLQTEPDQRLTADRIVAGIPIDKPQLQFQVISQSGDPVLQIDRLVMNLFGGAAEIRDGEINPFREVNELKLALTSLSLEELVALGDFEDVEVSGQLNGIIPIRFDGKTISVLDGALESSGPGVLKVRSEQARQALSAGGSQTKLLFDILENFNYSKLSLKINKPAAGEDQVNLHAEGVNPNVEDSRPVILNVNLSTNLDRIFNTILEGYLLSEDALRATLKNR